MDYSELLNGKMPKGDWICLLTSSNKNPNYEDFENFRRKSISKGLLEFKGHGTYGELLHDWFDETAAIMMTMEKHPEIETMTTWHNNESLAGVFWQCFFATCLPDETNYEKLKIICSDLDGINREIEITQYLTDFERGWIPEN